MHHRAISFAGIILKSTTMKLKTSLCLTLFALSLCVAGCTKKTFEITLTDHKTGLPIEDAEVKLLQAETSPGDFFRYFFTSPPFVAHAEVASARTDKTGRVNFEGNYAKYRYYFIIPSDIHEIDLAIAGETATMRANDIEFTCPVRRFSVDFFTGKLHALSFDGPDVTFTSEYEEETP